MQIVIEIPEEKYQWIKEHRGRTDYQVTEMLYNRVRNGAPLPKGHGDLIDRKKLLKKKQYIFKTQEMPFPRADHFIKTEDLLAAQTIIEAEKGAEK